MAVRDSLITQIPSCGRSSHQPQSRDFFPTCQISSAYSAYRAVRREPADAGGIEDGHAPPAGGIAPGIVHPGLGGAVAVEIRGQHEGIARHQRGRSGRGSAPGSPGEKAPSAMDCRAWAEGVGVRGHRLVRIEAELGHAGGDLFHGQAEDEDVVRAPTCSPISTLAPSSVPMVSAPFSASFMLPVPEASMPGGGDLFGEIGGGHDAFGEADVVVGQIDHLQPAADRPDRC